MSSAARALPGSVLAALLLLAAGCARQSGTDIVNPSGSELQIGGGTPWTGGLSGRTRLHFTYHVNDRWSYRVRMTIREDNGSEPAQTSSFESGAFSHVQRTVQEGLRTYWVVENIENLRTGTDFAVTQLVRPDTRGLFRFVPGVSGTGSATVPAGSAQGGELAPGSDPGEWALLSFPLFVGGGWRVNDVTGSKRRVAGLDRLHLPGGEFAAWRIEETSATRHAPDRLTLWYAEVGLVQMRQRIVQELRDDQGIPHGQQVVDVEYVLTGFEPGTGP